MQQIQGGCGSLPSFVARSGPGSLNRVLNFANGEKPHSYGNAGTQHHIHQSPGGFGGYVPIVIRLSLDEGTNGYDHVGPGKGSGLGRGRQLP